MSAEQQEAKRRADAQFSGMIHAAQGCAVWYYGCLSVLIIAAALLVVGACGWTLIGDRFQ